MNQPAPRKKVLFFAETVTLAHIARCITLARALHSSGNYDIILAADSRFDDIIGPLPFKRLPLFSLSTRSFTRKLAQGLPVYNMQTLISYVHEDVAIIESIQPDFVIGDFRLSLAVSCRLKKVPYATLANAYWSPYANILYPVPELPITKIFGVPIAQKLFDWVRPVVFKWHTLAFNKVCKKFGHPSLGNDLRHIYTHADYTLYADIESLVPMKPAPSNHIFIGPVLWSANVPLPDWWQTLPVDNPIIYVTLGSSGNNSLLPLILETLSKMPVTVLCVTAKKIPLEKKYSNIFTSEFLPADLAVKKADIIICNGGSPMVYQSIAENKFVIGLPSNLDQYLMMSLIQNTEYGMMIRSGKVNQDVIAKTVSAALRRKKTYPPLPDNALDIGKIEQIIERAIKH